MTKDSGAVERSAVVQRDEGGVTAISAAYKWAVECVNDLDAFIKRLNSDSPPVDGPPEPSDDLQQVGAYAIPKGLVRRCSAAITAILRVLGEDGGLIQLDAASCPPEGWGDTRRVAEPQGLEARSPEVPLADALTVLERHVSDDTPHLVGLALLIGNLHDKIVTVPAKYGMITPGDPYPNRLSYHFEPQVDANVEPSIKEALKKVVRPEQTCVSYLRDALDEAMACKQSLGPI